MNRAFAAFLFSACPPLSSFVFCCLNAHVLAADVVTGVVLAAWLLGSIAAASRAATTAEVRHRIMALGCRCTSFRVAATGRGAEHVWPLVLGQGFQVRPQARMDRH